MMLDLFDFQTDAKNYLLDKTTDPNAKRKIIVKSPTGQMNNYNTIFNEILKK